MNIPSLAIKNHQFTLVVILLLVALGTASLLNMPRSEDPQFDFPMTLTSVVYPGTNPIDMEKLVVDPIEDAINELEDIHVIRTDIEDGVAIIQTEFIYGSDPDEKYDDVVAAIATIRDELPANIRRLKTDKVSPADINILQLAVSSPSATYGDLKLTAERLENRLERVSGVKRVEVKAYPEQQVQVKADLIRLAALDVSLPELEQSLRASAANIPGGHVNIGQRRFTVQTSGDFSSIEEIRRTIVRSSGDHVVYVQDIADVSFGDDLPSYLARHQGVRSVFVTVIQRKGSNIFNVTKALNEEVERFKPSLHESISIETVVDQSGSVDKRVGEFFNNLLQGLILVGIATILVLGFRASLVVVLAIPMSILIGLGWLDVSGFGIQQMSIAGLVIALGLLVDNAIVVTENVGRFMREGHDRLTSAIKGSSQVAWAVVSGTLTTILAFFPILLLPSHSGTFIRSMPVTVVITLIASLVIAVMLTPLMASRFLKQGQCAKKATHQGCEFGEDTPDQSAPWALKQIHRFAHGPYHRMLSFSLKRPWVIMIISVAVLVSTLSLFKSVGVSLFPKAEKPQILVNIETAEGSSFDKTYALAVDVEKIIAKHPQVTSVTTNIGKGNPRVYYNITPKREVPNYAQIYVQLDDTGVYQDVETFISVLRNEFKALPAARVTVQEFMQGPPYVAPIAVRVTGDDLEALRTVAIDIENLVKQTPGTVNVDNPVARHKVDIRININRDKAARLQIPIQSIDQAIRTALVGQTIGSYRDEQGEDYDIVIRSAGSERPHFDALRDVNLKSPTGGMIMLGHLVEIEMKSIIPRFQHHNLERMARVTADVDTGFQTEPVTNEIIAKLDQYDWPDGVHYIIGGEQENRKESFGGMLQALIIALLGIFAVLVLQFRSFIQPLIIFAAIPFAITGAILGLWVTGYTFSFTAFVGLTSLVGIVVNNSIILVDYANQIRGATKIKVESKQDIANAIIESGKTRLLPILLTTMTTIGGLLPLTLSGSSMWSPMGWAIIGGLVVSTVLTLLVVPVLYQWLSKPQTQP